MYKPHAHMLETAKSVPTRHQPAWSNKEALGDCNYNRFEAELTLDV
jgi:hypothetical protein